MPSSIKRARELGDDFALIFVESQGHTIQEAEAMAWDRKWMGTHAMWTTEAPFRTEGNGLPSFALLNNEGEIILSGNPLAMKKDIEEAIDAEIAKSKQAPEGTPKSLKKAWKSFAKGDYAKAVAAAQKVVDKGGEDSEDAQVTVDTFVKRVESEFGRVEWMLDNGYLIEAKDVLKALGKATKGLAAVNEQKTALQSRLDAPELEDELDAAKGLVRIEKGLYEDGFGDKTAKTLERFIKKNSGTKAAERAQHLLQLAKSS